MPTIHADSKSAPFAKRIAAAMTEDAKDLGLGRKKFDVRAPTGAASELAIVVGARADTRKGRSGNSHVFALTLDVTRGGMKRRLRVKAELWSGRVPDEKYRITALACAAARMLAPYFAQPAAKRKTVHVDAYYAQSRHSFRMRIVSKLAAQGFRTRVTLGLSDTDPDPSCWGYLKIPSVSADSYRNGKVALSPTMARAGGHEGKTTIRATLAPSVSEAVATRTLADKLVAWYGKLAEIATA